jgi:prepilin-type N-terminal cleavage/methylation domain-containing protein
MAYDHRIHSSGMDKRAFTLIEMLVVIAIVIVLTALAIPAFLKLQSAGDVTKAAYDMEGVLGNARSYAMANNTYVWVGFFEENGTMASTFPATAGVGRIVMSVVASQDGTMIYNPGSLPITSAAMTAGLAQVSKPVKIENTHLKTAIANDSVFPIGNGSGLAFATRPFVNTTGNPVWQIGDTALAAGSSQAPFQFPLGNPAPTAQYTFKTAIQFSPRGEVRVNDASQSVQPIIEVGLQPVHGAKVDAANVNVAAVQITGLAGEVKIYRK